VGRCIRFPVSDVRVFAGRDSTGVRGVRLAEADRVISMAILHGVDASPAEREAYMKHANAMRAAANAEEGEEAPAVVEEEDETVDDQVTLSIERIAELGGAEEFVLTVSTEGYGKRTSAYDYRRTGRGGQGLIAHDLSKRGGRLVASFPVDQSDEILLVTDQGQLIRCPVGEIRIAGRNTSGVTIFRTAEDEHVVSVERLEGVAVDPETAESDDDEADGGEETPQAD
jgi:DNA gyrase subunit A